MSSDIEARDNFRASLIADLGAAESRGDLRGALYLRAEIRDLTPEPPAPIMPAPKQGPARGRLPRLAALVTP